MNDQSGSTDSNSESSNRSITFDFDGMVARAGGDDSLLVPVMEMVERNISRMTDALQLAFETESANDLEFAAHKLKSQCMTIGAEPASTLCAELEQHGKAGVTDPAKKLWERTKPILDKTRQALLTKLVDTKAET